MTDDSVFAKGILSRSEAETEALGRRLAARLVGGELIALHGELGAGKTVFARGLARGLGITEVVTSPSFTLVQEYRGPALRLYHVDLYRLNGAADALAFGLDELIADDQAVTVVEWPERLAGLLAGEMPEKLIHVQIRHGKSGREIRFGQ